MLPRAFRFAGSSKPGRNLARWSAALAIMAFSGGAGFAGPLGRCVPVEAEASEAIEASMLIGSLTCQPPAQSPALTGQDMTCDFVPVRGEPVRYKGQIRQADGAIAELGRKAVAWHVIARAGALQPGDLSGRFTLDPAARTAPVLAEPASAQPLLIGGPRNAITLHPVSIPGRRAVNVAASVREMSLDYSL
jgi:hypothetical protein